MKTHILSILSSPTLANMVSIVACQSTSYRSRVSFMNHRLRSKTYTDDGGVLVKYVERLDR